MFPVFSLALDEDVSADIALMYPELYQELMKGRSLTLKTFFVWVLISIYQGQQMYTGISPGGFPATRDQSILYIPLTTFSVEEASYMILVHKKMRLDIENRFL